MPNMLDVRCMSSPVLAYYCDIFSFALIIASEDYNSTSLSVTFDPGESEMSVQVPIINDLLREESETFYGNLMFYYQSELLQQVQLTGVTASIEILYNDCKS